MNTDDETRHLALAIYASTPLTPDVLLAQAVDAQWNVETPAAGLQPHQGENRHQRRASVASWEGAKNDDGKVVFTRRQAREQHHARKLGKLDPELRRLQKRKLKGKP